MQKNNKQVIKLAKGYLGQQLQQGFLTAAVGNTPYPVIYIYIEECSIFSMMSKLADLT